MKLCVKPFFGIVFLLLIVSGCQFGNSTTTANDNTQDNQNQKEVLEEKNNVDHEGTEEIEKNDKASISSGVNVAVAEESLFSIGTEQTINDISVNLLSAREITVDYVEASKDKFIGLELEITNKTEEQIEISSLPQLFLIANGENQDIALIDTKGDIDKKIEPGETIVGELAFDSEKSNQYEFIFKDKNTDEILVWTFDDSNILVENAG